MYGWRCTIHIFSLGGYDAPAVILLLITLARDVESNPGPPKIYMCPICSQLIINNKKYKGSVLCISCKDWVHTTCTTLTNTKQYTNTWTYAKCNGQATPPVTTPHALSTTNITPVTPTITPHPTMQDNSTPNSPSHTQRPSRTPSPTLNRAPRPLSKHVHSHAPQLPHIPTPHKCTYYGAPNLHLQLYPWPTPLAHTDHTCSYHGETKLHLQPDP